MNNRLLAVANFIKNADQIIDVGCDHAWLSIFLIQNKLCNNVINIDCNIAPLENGKRNVNKQGLSSKISFILNNGLENLKLDKKIDYITICGMGAQNIIDIITNSSIVPDFYIVQPNNNVPKLRQWLKNNQYKIINEIVIIDNDIYYEILVIKKDETNINNNIDIYIGPINKLNNLEIFKNYLIYKLNYFSNFDLKIINHNLRVEIETIKEYCNEKKWIS